MPGVTFSVMFVGLAVNEGVGFTVTVTDWLLVTQPLKLVVYKYSTVIALAVVFNNTSLIPFDPLFAALFASATLVQVIVVPSVALDGV